MGFDGATVMILVLLLLAVVLVLVFLRYVPLGLWVRALSSGVKVKVSALIGMRLRRISPHRLVDTLIMVRKAGLDITLDQLEKHLLAGGNIERVAKAMISAQQASIPHDLCRSLRHRSGRPRRAAGRADERQPQGH